MEGMGSSVIIPDDQISGTPDGIESSPADARPDGSGYVVPVPGPHDNPVVLQVDLSDHETRKPPSVVSVGILDYNVDTVIIEIYRRPLNYTENTASFSTELPPIEEKTFVKSVSIHVL